MLYYANFYFLFDIYLSDAGIDASPFHELFLPVHQPFRGVILFAPAKFFLTIPPI